MPREERVRLCALTARAGGWRRAAPPLVRAALIYQHSTTEADRKIVNAIDAMISKS